jgi:adenosylcobyric acid synthase
MLLDEDERRRVKGLVINKFRGDVSLLKPGLDMLEKLLNIPVAGVIPYTHLELEDEDTLVDYDKECNNTVQEEEKKEEEIDKLAEVVRQNVDLKFIYSLFKR